MAYEVTATRKRPQTFDDLVGQEFVATTLRSSIAQGRIAHAYLFAGPRGVGKTSVARIVAKALNCEKGPTDSPCGVCPACREIARGAALDVIEIDGASNTSVNDVREIRDEVLFAPNASRYKVYIIDEVHMLSNSAFNALLKTIEEPPPYIVFIFATTEVHKVPATIRSRCQQYNFRLISAGEIKEKLREAAVELGAEPEESALAWIAKEATGSLRDAYTLLDQVASFSGGKITLEKIREKLGVLGLDEMNDFARLLRSGDTGKVLERLEEVLATGVSVEQFTADLAEYFRNLLLIKSGITRDTILGYDPKDFDQQVLEALSAPQAEKAVELLLALYRGLRFSLSQRFELELCLSRLTGLDGLITTGEIREAIARMRSEISGAPGVTVSAPRRGSPMASAGPTRAAASGAPPGDAQDPGAPQRPAGGPGAEIARDSGGAAAEAPDPKGMVLALIESFRREKPSLASWLEKGAAAEVEAEELRLTFSARDRFAGEQILKERELVSERIGRLFGTPLRLSVSFREAKSEEAGDPRVELIRKVFRGEVVKGEGHGNEPL
jgi:DNA polymerase III subunit gamma/tau